MGETERRKSCSEREGCSTSSQFHQYLLCGYAKTNLSYLAGTRGVEIGEGIFNCFCSLYDFDVVHLFKIAHRMHVLCQEMVLISDPMTEVLPATFSLINQQSNRSY